MRIDTRFWTYGAEHEWADWPLSTQLPKGYGRDVRDITIVNSNGVANDPSGKLYEFGGEINTPPTDTVEGQVNCLRELKELLPMAKVNYRSNLHIHVRVPGLKDDLEKLKKIQRYIHDNMPIALPGLQHLPKPTVAQYPDLEERQGAQRRWRRRRVSHQTLLTPARVERQLQATTVEEFFRLEPPQGKDGKPLWHCQPRLCVNLRQMLETDTVEFRHFAGTLDEATMRKCVSWCRDFLVWALLDRDIESLFESYQPSDFPPFPEYNHELEKRYRATVHDGTVPREQIVANIKSILEGTFA
jgi:hypothetical protein